MAANRYVHLTLCHLVKTCLFPVHDGFAVAHFTLDRRVFRFFFLVAESRLTLTKIVK